MSVLRFDTLLVQPSHPFGIAGLVAGRHRLGILRLRRHPDRGHLVERSLDRPPWCAPRVRFLSAAGGGGGADVRPRSAAPGTVALFLGLGATAGANSVISGALWAEVFGIDSLGMVRGVYTGFMVLATAVSPLLFGLALERGVSMTLLAWVVSAYVIVVPWLAGRWLPGPATDHGSA